MPPRKEKKGPVSADITGTNVPAPKSPCDDAGPIARSRSSPSDSEFASCRQDIKEMAAELHDKLDKVITNQHNLIIRIEKIE